VSREQKGLEIYIIGFPTCNTNQNRKEEAKGQQAIYVKDSRHKNWFVIVFSFYLHTAVVRTKGYRADARGEEAIIKRSNM
jgi:hypothetical protein